MLKVRLKKTTAVILAVLTMLSVLAFAPLTADAAATVSTAREETYYLGNRGNVTYSMPKINMNTTDVNNINAEIRRVCEPVFDLVERESRYYESNCEYMRYTSAVKNNVLSLVVDIRMYGGNDTYYVYNINATTGKRLTNNQVAAACGTTFDNCKKVVKWLIRNAFKNLDSRTKSSTNWGDKQTRSLSESNLSKIQIYMTEYGLEATYDIYWIAGPEKHSCVARVYSTSAPAVNVHATNSGAEIKWSDVPTVQKYRVYKKVNGSWQKIGDSTGLKMVDKSAKAGNNYVYTVRGISGDASAFTSAFKTSGKSLKFLKTPQITKAEIIRGGIKLTWNKLAGAGKYRVYFRSNGAGSWQNLGDVYENSASLYCYGSGGKFTYTIRALSADGKQFFSGYNTSGKTIKYVYDPEITGISNTSKGVKLTYSKPTGTEKFRVYRKTQGGSWGKIADTTATTYTDGTAKNGTRYYYTVRCISSTGKSFQSYYDTAGKTIVCKR